MTGLAGRLVRGDRRPDGATASVADAVAADPALAAELVECLFHPDARVRMRAAASLERVSRSAPHAVDPFVDRLLGEAALLDQAEVRWHLARLLPRLTLDEGRRWRAAALMTQWFGAEESRIVRTAALQAMVDLAEGYGPLRDVAAEMMRRALDSGVSSLAARARRILNPLQVDRRMLDAVMKPAEPAPPLVLTLMAGTFAVCRLPTGDGVPGWVAWDGPLVAVTRTADEISVVCADGAVPEGVRAERDWRAFRVEGPLDFALTGILARLTAALAEAAIPVFALSTYDTDYLLVRAAMADPAAVALAGVARVRRDRG